MAENGPIELGIKINADQAARDIEKFSKQSRIAIKDLSLVLQDLPFGFIAIQNNLPALLSSFGQLDTKSQGLKGALKELGSTLLGAGGLYLAFSAATAITTFAIKEYGSLGAAFEALVGKTNKYANAIKDAKDAQKEFNESAKSISELQNQASGSYETASIKLQALSQIVLDETKSEKQRKNALEQLKDLDKDRFKNFDLEKTSLQGLTTAVDEYTNSLIANAVAKQYESEIAKTTINLNNQRDKLFELQKQLDDTNSRYPDLAKNADEYNKTTNKFTIPKEIEDYRNLVKAVSDQQAVVTQIAFPKFEELRKKFEDAISEVNQYYNIGGKGKSGKAGNALKVALDTQDLDAAFNLDKIISNITKYGNVLLDTNNSVKERKNALQELIAINPEVLKGLSIESSAIENNKKTLEEFLRILEIQKKERAFDARSSEVNTELRKAEQKATDDLTESEEKRFEAISNLTYAQDKFGNSTDRYIKTALGVLKPLKEIQDLNEAVIETLTKGLNLEDGFNKNIEALLNFEEFTNTSVQRISRNLRFLQEPLEGLFETALSGAGANWKKFADDVIQQIKRITAALLAKAFISGLANILAPGSGSLVSAGLKKVSDQALLDFLESGVNQPSFGGVSGGPLQMAGAVNLSLRGSDLVGSINRTNATINRVG